jgi:hypothetical protein
MSAHSSEGVRRKQVWMHVPELRENLQHGIRIPEARERTVHRAQPFLASGQSTAGVGFDELNDGAHLLDALARFVNRLVLGRSRLPESITRRPKFFLGQPPQPMVDQFLRP